MRKRCWSPLALVLLVLAAPGCASSGSGGGTGSNPDLITRAELSENPTLSAYDLIQRIRPRWLQGRSGEQPVVFMDGAQMGGVQFLRSVRVSDLEQIRHLSGRDATTRYGTGYGGGTIELSGRRGE